MPSFDPHALAAWCDGHWCPGPPARLTGVSHDSRRLPHGALFVALRGDRFDGHQFAEAVWRAGASAILADRVSGLRSSPEHPLLVVDDTRRALLELAAGYRRTLTAPMIGITGSVGKSTVKEMTAALLGGEHEVARTLGNWNNDIGLPLSLLRMAPEARAGVFEIGMNRPGEIAGLARVLAPDCGIVTAIGPVHMEQFADVDAVAREKAALLEALPRDGLAVIHADGPYSDLLAGCCAAPVVKVAALESDCRADLYWSHSAADGAALYDSNRCRLVTFTLPVPGRHNVANAALAAALAVARFGLAPALIAARLAGYQPLPMRWQTCTAGGIQIINDAYNANPMSMHAALEVFRSLAVGGRKWLVLGDMLELGADAERYHAELGRDIASHAWGGVIGVGPLAGHVVGAARALGLADADSTACRSASDAGDYLLPRLKAGDAVLLKGSRGMALEVLQDRLCREFSNPSLKVNERSESCSRNPRAV